MGNDTDTGLSPQETDDLRVIAGTMVPASAEHGIPGADDPLIFADLLRSLGRDLPQVRQAIAGIASRCGGTFAAMGIDDREACIAACHATGDAAIVTLGRVILGCYYRDDRVLVSLGHEPRAPFPKGNILEQGDWTLLDAVRARPQFWRDDRRA